MKTILKTVMAAGIALGLAMSAVGTAEATKCQVLGGKGTAALPELATDQARWQLDDAAKAFGGKAASKEKTSCSTQLVVSEGTVKQRYCK